MLETHPLNGAKLAIERTAFVCFAVNRTKEKHLEYLNCFHGVAFFLLVFYSTQSVLLFSHFLISVLWSSSKFESVTAHGDFLILFFRSRFVVHYIFCSFAGVNLLSHANVSMSWFVAFDPKIWLKSKNANQQAVNGQTVKCDHITRTMPFSRISWLLFWDFRKSFLIFYRKKWCDLGFLAITSRWCMNDFIVAKDSDKLPLLNNGTKPHSTI